MGIIIRYKYIIWPHKVIISASYAFVLTPILFAMHRVPNAGTTLTLFVFLIASLKRGLSSLS